MQSWDKASIQAEWRPIGDSIRNVIPELSSLEQAYHHFYGIDFEKQNDGIAHHFGYQKVDGFKLATHLFRPENGETHGTVLALHGYFDHAGLYKHLIKFCLEKNFSVLIYDLPGHGLSTGHPGGIDDFYEYVRVLKHYVEFAQALQDQPLHIVGQSTGCAIIMEYLMQKGFDNANNPFCSITLLAPLVRPEGWKKLLWSYRWLSPLVTSVKRKYMDCSNDTEFLEFLRNHDPLQYHRIPVNWVTSLINWEEQFAVSGRSQLSPVIIQGGEDDTIDWRHNLDLIYSKFNRPSIKFLPEARHHLVNESAPIRKQVFAELAAVLVDEG